MSEKAVEYIAKPKIEDLPWAEFKKSACLKPFKSGDYVPPGREEISTLINKMGWDHRAVSEMVGVQFDEENGRGSTTIKNWLRHENSSSHRKITYAVWRLMLVNAGLVKS